MTGHGGHDPLILVRIRVPIIDVGDHSVRWLAIRSIASRPKPSPVILVKQVRLRSCGVARSIPSSATSCRINSALDLAGLTGEMALDQTQRRLRQRDPWSLPFLVPASHPRGLPGNCHHPRRCEPRMAATSPGLWPVRRISLSAGSSSATASRPRIGENALTIIGRISINRLHGLIATISCLTAQEKIADAEASTWLATIGASILIIDGANVGAGDGARPSACPSAAAGGERTRALGLPPRLVVLPWRGTRRSRPASSAKVSDVPLPCVSRPQGLCPPRRRA